MRRLKWNETWEYPTVLKHYLSKLHSAGVCMGFFQPLFLLDPVKRVNEFTMACIFTFWNHSDLNDRKRSSKVTRTARGKALSIGVPERKPLRGPNDTSWKHYRQLQALSASRTRSRHWWSGDLRICSVILMYTEERWCIRWRQCWVQQSLSWRKGKSKRGDSKREASWWWGWVSLASTGAEVCVCVFVAIGWTRRSLFNLGHRRSRAKGKAGV